MHPLRLIAGAAAAALALSACALTLSACAPRAARRQGPPPTNPPPPAGRPTPSVPSNQPRWIDARNSPFAVRGIVEGFYGAPWTQAKRLAAFDFMARVGLNTYVYAPKDDPYQRAEWRRLYPEAELARFRALLERARQDGVNFVYSISPGLDITYSSDADRQALTAKVDQLGALGIHTVMFSVDDVPEQLSPTDAAAYGNDYALAQADLANWLNKTQRARDASFTLWMTPSHYWGTRADVYLTSLGAKLDPSIPLIWTGPDVVSRQITAAEADAFAAIVRRRPIIWDNYPVNDYTYAVDKKPRLILGPIRGRDAALADRVAGYLLNPMNQEEASQLPLYTAAAYLARPAAYRPDAAWRDAARRLAPDAAGAAVLLEFAAYAQSSMVQAQEAPQLTAALAAYARGSFGASWRLKRQFASMVSLPARLAGAVPPEFYDEVQPWAAALRDEGEAGLLALGVDTAVARRNRPAVQAGLPDLRRALANLKAQQATAHVAGNLVEDFLAGVVSRAEGLGPEM